MVINFIFSLLGVAFYIIHLQRKIITRERLKKQISDSLLIGLMEYSRCQISNLGFCVNGKILPEKDSLSQLAIDSFDDNTLQEVFFYSFLVDSFESWLTEEEYDKLLVNSKWKLDLFVDKSCLTNAKFCISDEPLRDLYLTTILISLYKDEKTQKRALAMMDSVPIKVKEKITAIINHPKFSKVIN